MRGTAAGSELRRGIARGTVGLRLTPTRVVAKHEDEPEPARPHRRPIMSELGRRRPVRERRARAARCSRCTTGDAPPMSLALAAARTPRPRRARRSGLDGGGSCRGRRGCAVCRGRRNGNQRRAHSSRRALGDPRAVGPPCPFHAVGADLAPPRRVWGPVGRRRCRLVGVAGRHRAGDDVSSASDFTTVRWPDVPTGELLDAAAGARPVVLIAGDLHAAG